MKKALKIRLFEALEHPENIDFSNGATATATATATASQRTRTAIIEFVQNYDKVKTEIEEKKQAEKLQKELKELIK